MLCAGYYYIILDDCWSNGRTSNGTLQANATKFPDGIPAVAEKIHGMGLGWGMYSSAGKYTCAQYGKNQPFQGFFPSGRIPMYETITETE